MPALFHDSYAAARTRFLDAGRAAGFVHTALELPVTGPEGETLCIDVAVKQNGPIKRAVVVSSGTHGVEGYFGSAVQLSLLDDRLQAWTPAEGEAVVLIHGVNPWGMAHKRRVNEHGVDLNRNFRQDGEAYAGAPDGYRSLDGLLNPPSPPNRLEPFTAMAVAQILRFGFGAIKEAVASGQYDYDRGLFFGGKGPSTSNTLLREHLTALFDGAERVVHIDLHTGMGKWGTYCLAVDFDANSDRVRRLKREFGDRVQGLEKSGVLYKIHGALGPWLQSILPDVHYDCMLAEFGTWNVLRVIHDLREENRMVHHGTSPAMRERARSLIVETFCPADEEWRRSCVDKGRALFEQAIAAQF